MGPSWDPTPSPLRVPGPELGSLCPGACPGVTPPPPPPHGVGVPEVLMFPFEVGKNCYGCWWGEIRANPGVRWDTAVPTLKLPLLMSGLFRSPPCPPPDSDTRMGSAVARLPASHCCPRA